MTRSEEINRAAEKFVGKKYKDNRLVQISHKIAFEAGARWADENPNTKNGCVECGGVVLADTEKWPNPLCYGCYIKHFFDLNNPWRKLAEDIMGEIDFLMLCSGSSFEQVAKMFMGKMQEKYRELVEKEKK